MPPLRPLQQVPPGTLHSHVADLRSGAMAVADFNKSSAKGAAVKSAVSYMEELMLDVRTQHPSLSAEMELVLEEFIRHFK